MKSWEKTARNGLRAQVGDALTQPYSQTPVAGTGINSPAAEISPVALIVCHGMGQQIRHETLAAVAENLHSGRSKRAKVRYVCFKDSNQPSDKERLMPRAEIEVVVPAAQQAPENPEKRVPVHIYEVYWAPLTEGQIGLYEVIWFLSSKGIGRALKAFSQFNRWVFGGEKQFKVGRTTHLYLLLLWLFIISLVITNGVLVTVVAHSLLEPLVEHPLSAVLVNRLTTHLVLLMGWVAVVFLSFRLFKLFRRRGLLKILSLIVWLLIGGAGVLLLMTAVCMLKDYIQLRNGCFVAHTWPWPLHSFQLIPENELGRVAWILLVWLATVGVSIYCRSRLVQYLGDVVIYLEAYQLDRYFSIRNRIKRLARHTLEAVYGARSTQDPTRYQYQRVVVMGHSLGSVVAYDALNAQLLADEALGRGGLQVSERTQALVTFGSPLDKVAYLFQSKRHKTNTLQALEASRQPLIEKKNVRADIQWFNLYSNQDIISGALDYYDDPTPPQAGPGRVENCIDPTAVKPLLAHVQYWGRGTLWLALRWAVSGQRIPHPLPLPPEGR